MVWWVHDAAPSVRLVSLADRLHNARATVSDLRRDGDELWGRFNGGKDGTLWYYRAVLGALRGTDPAWLVDELQRVVDEMGKLSLDVPQSEGCLTRSDATR